MVQKSDGKREQCLIGVTETDFTEDGNSFRKGVGNFVQIG